MQPSELTLEQDINHIDMNNPAHVRRVLLRIVKECKPVTTAAPVAWVQPIEQKPLKLKAKLGGGDSE